MDRRDEVVRPRREDCEPRRAPSGSFLIQATEDDEAPVGPVEPRGPVS